jgi:hypothetical protein
MERPVLTAAGVDYQEAGRADASVCSHPYDAPRGVYFDQEVRCEGDD